MLGAFGLTKLLEFKSISQLAQATTAAIDELDQKVNSLTDGDTVKYGDGDTEVYGT